MVFIFSGGFQFVNIECPYISEKKCSVSTSGYLLKFFLIGCFVLLQ